MTLMLPLEYPEEFIRNIISSTIPMLFYSTLNVEKLIKFNILFQTNTFKVLETALHHLKYDFTLNGYRVYIDPTFIYSNNIKLIDICKFINNGNIAYTGYPIISNIFTKVEDNIDTYYFLYQERGF